MFGALMYVTKLFMEILPNIHLLGMFIMVLTIVFRAKALIPIYLFVFATGFYNGFSMWWVPYLYIWAVLWGVTMLLPKKMPNKAKAIIYPIVCCLHGLLYGVLYAPAQALLVGYNFQQMLAWIAAGFTFDILHGIGNLCAGILILPLSNVLIMLVKKTNKSS